MKQEARIHDWIRASGSINDLDYGTHLTRRATGVVA